MMGVVIIPVAIFLPDPRYDPDRMSVSISIPFGCHPSCSTALRLDARFSNGTNAVRNCDALVFGYYQGGKLMYAIVSVAKRLNNCAREDGVNPLRVRPGRRAFRKSPRSKGRSLGPRAHCREDEGM